MAIRKGRPGEGPTRAHEHFRYSGTPAGHKWPGYVAGPCLWVYCHASDRSKICVAWATNNAVRCTRCGGPVEVELLGYLPVYRQVDWKPVLVVVHEEMYDQVEALGLHERIEVGRESGEDDPVWVRKTLAQEPAFRSTLECRQRAADVTETMLAIWGIPEYTFWYRCQQQTSDTPVSLPKDPPVTSTGGPFGPMTQAAAERYSAPAPVPPTADAEYEALLEQMRARAGLTKPSKNGKHPKPK